MFTAPGDSPEQNVPKISVQFETVHHPATDFLTEAMLRRKPLEVQPNGRQTQRQFGGGLKVLFVVIQKGFTGDLEFTTNFDRKAFWHFVQESRLDPDEKMRLQDLLYDRTNESHAGVIC